MHGNTGIQNVAVSHAHDHCNTGIQNVTVSHNIYVLYRYIGSTIVPLLLLQLTVYTRLCNA